ncbi:MAG TPA: hypothetical protein VNQ73_15350 [Ilumatobacter sp.]|nr:hypothetical protein [Ilumatobacter sp.]
MKRLLLLTALFIMPPIPAKAMEIGDHVAIVAVQAAVAGELRDGFVNSNPCEATAPHTVFSFQPTPRVRSGEVTYTYDVMADATPESQSAMWFVSGGGFADFYGTIDIATFSSVTITHRRYLVGCGRPDNPNDLDPATSAVVWVPVITETSLVPDVLAELVELIPSPDTFFPVADPTYGWLYVKTPMEVRVGNLEAVAASVTAANAVSSATATATAEPVEVVFEPGEPGGPATVCSVAAAQAGWDRNNPHGSGCLYTYQNSSAITPSHQFQTRTRVRWHVTGTGGIDVVLETIAYDAVGVAEVQAVVVAP